jgi:hypothetical protein
MQGETPSAMKPTANKIIPNGVNENYLVALGCTKSMQNSTYNKNMLHKACTDVA